MPISWSQRRQARRFSGLRGFFRWLERKKYKVHVRVLLSKYRAYTPCTTCGGARLKSEAQAWRLGTASRGGGDPGCEDPIGDSSVHDSARS